MRDTVDQDAYTIDGIAYTRVTKILEIVGDPSLMRWYGDVGTKRALEISSAAAAFGTKVHSILEMRFDGYSPDAEDVDPKVLQCADAFEDALCRHGLTLVESEIRVVHRELLYAGTCDGIVREDKTGRLRVLDWKTSKHLRVTYPLQLSAYAEGLKYSTPAIDVDGGVIIRGKPGQAVEVAFYDDIPKYFDLFKCAVALYRYKKVFEQNAEA